MKGNEVVIGPLNDLLSLELSAINQYLAHSKMCQNWGYERLAERFRQVSVEEMKDAEKIIERILFLDGRPGMEQPSGVTIAATIPEQLRSALETERQALKLVRQRIATALVVDDQAKRESLAGRLPDEEGHPVWFEDPALPDRQHRRGQLFRPAAPRLNPGPKPGARRSQSTSTWSTTN